jgi:hypothetical protein
MVLEREILPFLVWLLPRVDSDGALQLGCPAAVVDRRVRVDRRVVVHRVPADDHRPGAGRRLLCCGQIGGDGDHARTFLTPLAAHRAMAKLAILESMRRRVLIVFFVFALLLLFAGWFLDPASDHPARLYISFVLTATERLMLAMAILLSVFSLPNDIKNRTIYTVVTKPVRATEIVLGRALGFCAVNTVLLVLMGGSATDLSSGD